ncbi:MAG TPA: heme exporter protein CcmB [Polyangiaceae bacterium]
MTEGAPGLPPHGHARVAPSWLEQTRILLGKDVTIEVRTGEVLVTSGFFAVLVVVLGSLAFYLGPDTRGQVAAGVIWLAVTFAAVLALGRLWQREREEGAFDGVLLAPIAPSAVFAGKALGLLGFLFLIEAVVVPLSALFFSLEVGTVGVGLVLIALVATPGIAAAGTLFGAMTARTRARDLVLAVVLLALLAPAVLTAVAATRELLGGATLPELGDYFRLLGVFDVAFVAGGLGLFGMLVDG